MKKFIKENIIVILAITLPIAFLFIILLVSYIPTLFISTDYDFLYSCRNDLQFSIVNEKLKVEQEGKIFLYDAQNNRSREISLDQAKQKRISPISSSPDGINFVSSYERYSADLLFYHSRRENVNYLNQGRINKRINLIGCRDYYRDNINFIGWVLKDN